MTVRTRRWRLAAAALVVACVAPTEPDSFQPGVYVVATFDGKAGPPFAINDAQCGDRRSISQLLTDTLFLGADSSARRVFALGDREFRNGVEQPASPPRVIALGGGRFGRDTAGVWIRYLDPRRGELGPASWYRVRNGDLVNQTATGVRCSDGTGTPNRHVETVYTRR